jgi:hypothetical protein
MLTKKGERVRLDAAMLCSRCGTMLDITVPEALRWADRILLMMDNHDSATEKVVDGLRERFGERVIVAHSGYPKATEKEESRKGVLYNRFRRLQPNIRDRVFREIDGWEVKPEALLFPDSDEIMSDFFPDLFSDFWYSDKKGIRFRPISVFGDMQTISRRTMAPHLRVFKWQDGITAFPYRGFCYYTPFGDKEVNMVISGTLIHLHHLTLEKREFRNKHWSSVGYDPEESLWRLPKPVTAMRDGEIYGIMSGGSDLTIEQYLNRHNL